MDLHALADLAEHAARQAAAVITRARMSTIHIADTKSSATDLVTETDRAVETLVIDIIGRARPGDGFIGEETGARVGSSGVTWIIDPIDGTTNFYYDLPGYNVSIAAHIDGQVAAGVVVDPVRDEVFRATRGGGATCNGDPIHPGTPPDLDRALIGTGFSYDADRRRAQAETVTGVIGRVRDVRRLGAAALDLCHVAAGRLDGYFESGLKPWDLAAGGLVASEAGCRVTGPRGDPPDERLVVAASPAIADDLIDLLGELAAAGLAVEDPSARRGWKFGRLEL